MVRLATVFLVQMVWEEVVAVPLYILEMARWEVKVEVALQSLRRFRLNSPFHPLAEGR